MRRRFGFAFVLATATTIVAAIATPSSALAGNDTETNAGGAAAAESMFQEARRLMDAKKYAEACPKFAASQKISSAIGTLLNLADCYEKNNQLASAWARFHEAIALAQRLGRSNREQTARERADKLEPRLIRLTIATPRGDKANAIDVVKLDGNPIDPAALGTPIPVDAGKHSIEASAKNKKTFTKDFEVSEKKKDSSVDIPPLEDDASAKGGADPKEGGPTPPITEPPKEERGGWSTQKTIGLIAGAAGVIGVGVGGYFGLKTSSTWNEAKTHCKNLPECDDTGVDLASQAKSSGNIATIAVIAGSALLVGGAVLFFTAPSDSRTTGQTTRAPVKMRAGVGLGSVVVGGTF